MNRQFSKGQIDRLGEKLRDDAITEDAIRLLDAYRRSFGPAYETVIGSIQEQLNLKATGRPAKSTNSIAEKLRRQETRLTQIQDIAGCRIIVTNISDQDQAVAALIKLFPEARIFDRRIKPSHGYQAVHVVPKVKEKPIEIQVRTDLQHLWAEFSEKLADLIDPTIKYGGGVETFRNFLDDLSARIAKMENLERRILSVGTARAAAIVPDVELTGLKADFDELKKELKSMLDDIISTVDRYRSSHP